MDRLIDSPNPMPSGLVVKNGSKMRGVFIGRDAFAGVLDLNQDAIRVPG